MDINTRKCINTHQISSITTNFQYSQSRILKKRERNEKEQKENKAVSVTINPLSLSFLYLRKEIKAPHNTYTNSDIKSLLPLQFFTLVSYQSPINL